METKDFVLRSTAFIHEGEIPAKYTCEGDDISPPLSWLNPPEGTVSFVLICDDPDVPVMFQDQVPDLTWDHWIVFNIPANVNKFDEGIKSFPKGVQFGKNTWGRNDYGGPCPPDRKHRYFFKLYALDTKLDIPDGISKDGLLQNLVGHVIGQTELMGRYEKKNK